MPVTQKKKKGQVGKKREHNTAPSVHPHSPSVLGIDYLNAFPVEIWRQILLIARSEHHWHEFIRQDDVLNPFYVCRAYHTRRKEDMVTAQAEFSQCLRICKAFMPLIEEILWSTIHLNAERLADGTFERSALGFGVLGKPRGEATREIWLFAKADRTSLALTNPILPWHIRTLCPNLSEYILFSDCQIRFDINAKNPFQRDARAAQWATNISSLMINSSLIEWFHLQYISCWFPSLHSLTISGANWAFIALKPVTFPHLRRLIFLNGPKGNILPAIDTPKLEYLRIQVVETHAHSLVSFLSRVKYTLVDLFVYVLFTNRYMQYASFLSRLFETATSLRRLITYHPSVRGLYSGSTISTAYSETREISPLRELVLIVDVLYRHRPFSSEQVATILRSHFPPELLLHLERVILVSELYIEDSDFVALLTTGCKKVMPDAQVQWRDLPEYLFTRRA